LAELDPDHAADYAARGEVFAAAIAAKLPAWEAAVEEVRGGHVLLYHQTWNYLVHWLRLDVYGEIEHRPGISPSPKHVQEMIDRGRELGDVIVVAATWSHVDTARQAAERIGAPLAVLPAATGADTGVDSYIALIDTIVERLAAAAAERSAP
jgi:zinc/manganese transport system substrate-binding protein